MVLVSWKRIRGRIRRTKKKRRATLLKWALGFLVIDSVQFLNVNWLTLEGIIIHVSIYDVKFLNGVS